MDMEAVKHTLEFVSSPVGIVVLSTLTGLLLLSMPQRRRLSVRLLVLGGVLFVLFTLTPIAEVAVNALERNYRPIGSAAELAGTHSIVVLAGFGRERSGIPITSSLSDSTVCRVTEGVRLYHLHGRSKVILSGGIIRPDQRAVAAMMADLMILLGIPAADIVVEGRSTTTFENLVEVRKLVGHAPFVLVAAARDLPRAMAVARRLGMAPVAAPACIRTLQSFPAGMIWSGWFWTVLDSFRYPAIERLADLQWAYHEYVGYLWYRLLGRI
jgi:uncharacterized SAM-binding protein YcdF (DUF218 family)